MKIIKVSNFNLDTINDVLVCENVNDKYANDILDFLNDKHCSNYSPHYFRLVKDDYKLYVYKP